MADSKKKYSEIASQMKDTFAGWEYPSAPQNGGSICVVFDKGDTKETSGAMQIQRIVEQAHAKNIKTHDGALYLALSACKNDVALVQPVYISVSGISRPAVYSLENYLMPTPLFDTVASTCLTNIKARMISKQKTLKTASIVEALEKVQMNGDSQSFSDLANNKALKIMLGDLMYSESLLHLTTQDAGLRFKDRQSTKILIAKRNQILWNFCDLLERSFA